MPAQYKSLDGAKKQGLCFPLVSAIIAIGIIGAGLVQQDWSLRDCKDPLTYDLSQVTKDTAWCPNITGGKYDRTLWSWITDFVLAAMFFVMAVIAPGAGDARCAFAIGFLVSGLSWLQDGISHLRFFENGGTDASAKVQDFLWFSSLLSGPAGEVVILATMLLVGGRNSCMGVLAESSVFSVGLGVVLYMADISKILTPMWKIFDIAMVSAISLQAISSALMLCSKNVASAGWSLLYLGTSAAAFGVQFGKPAPFSFNKEFNDSSLFHGVYMLSATSLFMLCGRLSSAFEAVGDVADAAREAALTTQMAPEEADPPRSWCACCTRRQGGTLVSTMQP